MLPINNLSKAENYYTQQRIIINSITLIKFKLQHKCRIPINSDLTGWNWICIWVLYPNISMCLYEYVLATIVALDTFGSMIRLLWCGVWVNGSYNYRLYLACFCLFWYWLCITRIIFGIFFFQKCIHFNACQN